MEDAAHLERMGRELKCPICLGLLNSAISLTCNHLFCNACIIRSMKTDATCPVCKVPYHRREVRAAPHMDSLVSIYRSMEISSGVNIFVTQNMPSPNKPSDKEKHVEADAKHVYGETYWDGEKKRKSKGKGLRKPKEINVGAPCPIVLNSSSQTKKRVQVPQHPSSENSKSTKSVRGVKKIKDTEKSLAGWNENPSPNKGVQQVLTPFFWLGDVEEGESLSQLSEDQLLDITPPNVPSFSDLKDSDNESPSKMKEHEESDAMDMFDSEMFEWTQRPCSPDILLSPVKAKVQVNHKVDRTQVGISGRASVKSTNKNRKRESGRGRGPRPGTGDFKQVSKAPSRGVNIGNSQTSSDMFSNKGTWANEKLKVKCAKRSADQGYSVQAGLNKLEKSDGNVQFKKKGRSRRTCSETSESCPADVSTLGKEVLDGGEQNQVQCLSDAQPEKKLSPGDNLGKRKRERKSTVDPLHSKDLSWSLKNQKLDGFSGGVLEELSKTERKTSKDEDTQDGLSFSSKADDMATSKPNKVPTKKAMKRNPDLPSHTIRQRRSNKKMKTYSEDILRDKLTHDGQMGDACASTKTATSTDNTGSAKKAFTTEKFSLESCLPLRRCETLANKFVCAFCHSSEESEASGEMTHYYKGEPVSADYNGGSMVIHAHKNCVEWAPNVYFEDVTAINLEAELSRSRRISCSCCGLKGAALGCYQKSCKRSFHFPCANLIPQCRWDADNFVMLCPSHSSSKLPCEEYKRKERKCELTPKGQLQPQRNQVAAKGDIYAPQSRSLHGLSKKITLCCSGLTIEEKKVVSDFAKLPGVKALRKWESSVTHVIASTNENGACKRTLKVLMGVLEGKWILSIKWIKACMKNMKYIDEEQYEITADVHGIQDGPHSGRLRALNKHPKLFDGFKFYLMGDFDAAYKGYLQNLVVAAGGTILRRRPIISGQVNEPTTSSGSSTFIIYSLELPDDMDDRKNKILSQRESDAEAIADSAGARAVSNSWVLNSIAACKLQALS